MALKDTARELGAVPAVMGAIRRFEDNAEIMEAGCSGIQGIHNRLLPCIHPFHTFIAIFLHL